MIGDDRRSAALSVGGPTCHIPVLCPEMIDALQLKPEKGGIYVDGTFGAGHYTRAILDYPYTRVIALDCDPYAIAKGAEWRGAQEENYQQRVTLIQRRFGDLAQILREYTYLEGSLEGLVLDLGVSSMQLDQPERGFSFRQEGPLDMRMEAKGPTAADFLNSAEEEEIADVLYFYGEERYARHIARTLVQERRQRPLQHTTDLTSIVLKSLPPQHRYSGKIHPATRTFQAVRIAVNDELVQLLDALYAAECFLKPGGRLGVVTFHSLEDRLVKHFLKSSLESATSAGYGRAYENKNERYFEVNPAIAGKQPIVPQEAELKRNPRARSAKLRVGERTALPARSPSIKKNWLDSIRVISR